MRSKALAALAAWGGCALGVAALGHAQTTYQADFDTTFPTFGYTYDYSGYGDPVAGNVDTSDRNTSSFDVPTSAGGSTRASATFDTTNWNLPGDQTYTYSGWGLGIGWFLPEDRRPTSGDLSQYRVTFDAWSTGYDEADDGISTDVVFIFQLPDDDDEDTGAEEFRLDLAGANIERLTTTPQTFSLTLDQFTVSANNQYDFTTQFADTFIAILQLQPTGSVNELGTDADNVVLADNIRIQGPFAAPFGGDFNGDLIVDGADFLAWQRGESNDPLSTADLDVWKANFGQTAPVVSMVPEPATLALAGAAVLGLLASSRRRR